MAAETTTRLNVYRWESDGDDFTREQMTHSHDQLEDRVARFIVGTTEPADAPLNQYVKSFFLNSSSGVISYWNSGTNSWSAINSTASAVDVIPGGSNSAGSASTLAKSDHTHALFDWGSSTQNVSTVAAAGSANLFARADHVHAIANNAVTTATINSGAVTSDKVAANAVGTSAIVNSAVTKAKIAAEAQLPSGMIASFGGVTAPTGWLLCDGEIYSQTDPLYAALFAVIGTNFGQGAAGTFRVPDLRNRVPRGTAVGGTAIGIAAGSDTASILVTNLPAHNHAYSGTTTSNGSDHTHAFSDTSSSNGAHSHTLNWSHDHGFPAGWDHVYRRVGSGYWLQAGGAGVFNLEYGLNPWSPSGGSTATSSALNHTHVVSGTTGQASTAHTHTFSGTTGNAGTGTALTVTPAHVGVNFIIKL